VWAAFPWASTHMQPSGSISRPPLGEILLSSLCGPWFSPGRPHLGNNGSAVGTQGRCWLWRWDHSHLLSALPILSTELGEAAVYLSPAQICHFPRKKCLQSLHMSSCRWLLPSSQALLSPPPSVQPETRSCSCVWPLDYCSPWEPAGICPFSVSL